MAIVLCAYKAIVSVLSVSTSILEQLACKTVACMLPGYISFLCINKAIASVLSFSSSILEQIGKTTTV